MSEPPNPWKRDAPASAGLSARTRLLIWLGTLAAIIGLAWLLIRAFPEQSLSGYDQAQAIYAFSLIALLSSSVIFGRQFRAGEALRNIAIWAGIAAVLGLGYLYRDVFSDIGSRLRAEMLPAEPRAVGDDTVALTESEGGNYFPVGEVDGVRIKFLVDTGASDIVLSPDDASRLGIDVAALNFTGETETANGIGRSAPWRVRSLAIGPLRFSSVAVSINQAPMGSSLLGMSFLRRLKSFEFKGRTLLLHG